MRWIIRTILLCVCVIATLIVPDGAFARLALTPMNLGTLGGNFSSTLWR